MKRRITVDRRFIIWLTLKVDDASSAQNKNRFTEAAKAVSLDEYTTESYCVNADIGRHAIKALQRWSSAFRGLSSRAGGKRSRWSSWNEGPEY